MNILFVNWHDRDHPEAGGAEEYLQEITSRLVRKGHAVTLLCSRGRGQRQRDDHAGMSVIRIGRRSLFNFVAPAAVRAILRTQPIDIVVDDLNKIPFFTPLVTRRPVVPMVMHLFRGSIYRETNFLAASYVYGAERFIPLGYRNRRFVAISRSTADDLRDLGVRGTIHIIKCGIPSPAGQENPARRVNLVAYVGRVKAYKSIDHFIRALALLKTRRPIETLIVGTGDAVSGLKRLARQVGVDVRFTGFVSEIEKYRIYRQARVIVQPSVKEGWGLTAIEAQSCGTPVVCADSPGLSEVVRHGETGFHYPYGDLKALADRIYELLSDDTTWNRFSIAARRWAATFSWDEAAEELEAVLERARRG